ncbi:MAG: hypothetical protein PHO55_11385, partial [Thiomonas arsenitoxydans]|nr:hypothetical protein [Thiomonas arsenitoxydans]
MVDANDFGFLALDECGLLLGQHFVLIELGSQFEGQWALRIKLRIDLQTLELTLQSSELFFGVLDHRLRPIQIADAGGLQRGFV